MATLISGVLGIVMSLLAELVPGFTKRWGKLSKEWKKAIRAYIAAGIMVIAALLQYVGGVAVGFPEQFDVEAVLWIAATFAAFVIGAGKTYEAAGPFLPRKQ